MFKLIYSLFYISSLILQPSHFSSLSNKFPLSGITAFAPNLLVAQFIYGLRLVVFSCLICNNRYIYIFRESETHATGFRKRCATFEYRLLCEPALCQHLQRARHPVVLLQESLSDAQTSSFFWLRSGRQQLRKQICIVMQIHTIFHFLLFASTRSVTGSL